MHVYTLFGYHGVSGVRYGFCHVSSALVDLLTLVRSNILIDSPFTLNKILTCDRNEKEIDVCPLASLSLRSSFLVLLLVAVVG